MAIEWQNTPTQWQNIGVEPSDTLKTNGYSGGDRPAADTFNHIFNNNYKCISEIQTQIENFSDESDPNVSNATGTLAISHGGTGATTAAIARSNLGAMANNFSNASTTLSISKGGTGATTASSARNNLGLGTSSSVTFDKTISGSFEVVNSYPYIDFSPNSQTDYEVRIAKNDTNQLNIEASSGNAILKINGANVQTQGHVYLAGQCLYNGYSFQNDGAYNTGMFSERDDDLKFVIGSNISMYTHNGRLVFSNGTVYVQDSQPNAPDGSLWAW